MSINFAQFPQPRLPLQGNDLVVGYQLIGSVPTLAQYTLTQMFVGVFPGGVIPVANGGTGLSTVPAGDLLVGTGTNTMNFIIPGAAGAMLISQGTSVSPQFGNNPIINGGSITNTPISGSTGAFTTVTASGTITPSQTAGIVGTTTNNNANAGSVGQFVSSTVLVGSAVSLTSTVTANVTSISLTAGDWDVWATVGTSAGAGTITQQINFWTSTASATLPIPPNNGAQFFQNGMTSANQLFVLPVGMQRISIAATTSVFLSVACSFSVSTLSAYGFIGARRVR